ncbi:hypothetical protein MJO28_001046 [Puccinia striiformis f. sp. tritici]|uniref:Uncharacterized protein n=2 Tax=Puccinia striiformis TaxID=27350 RepID=A0A2S4WNE1_9BASI|nr:hypothetical protein MJO28_001046 [Puccinia striiformis f. sp. tritici]KAI7966932.1 hypothetical protein MJO29_000209 [Puccinia striiformis f. sp. tritici]POW23295.1 hypothetical protein PSHT_00297 [Puccinia striiformis]
MPRPLIASRSNFTQDHLIFFRPFICQIRDHHASCEAICHLIACDGSGSCQRRTSTSSHRNPNPEKAPDPKQTKTDFPCPLEKPDGFCGYEPERNDNTIQGHTFYYYKLVDANKVKTRSFDCNHKPPQEIFCCKPNSLEFYTKPDGDLTRRVDEQNVKDSCADPRA